MIPHLIDTLGAGRAGSWNEQSQVVVETVTKSSTTKQYGALHASHDSDASKVTSKGAGLTNAKQHKDATFIINASRAGKQMF